MEVIDPSSAFEALLQYLKVNRGFDFTGYQPASLQRRKRKPAKRQSSTAPLVNAGVCGRISYSHLGATVRE